MLSTVIRSLLCVGTLLPLSLAHSAEKDGLRVVSVSGSLTEIVYELGMQDHLVGVDTTSVYPKFALEKPKVGYQRALSAENILSLKPDVVLGTDEAGPPTVIKQLKEAGVTVKQVPVKFSPEGVELKIEAVANVFDQEEQGKALVTELKQKMKKVSNDITEEGKKPRVMFLLNIGKGSPTAAGRDSAADAVIRLAGGENVFHDDFKGYKPVGMEGITVANPDVILMMGRTLKGAGDKRGVLDIPGVKLTNAGKQERIVSMDGMYLLGFSTRLPHAVNDLHAALFDKADKDTEQQHAAKTQ